MALGVAVEIQLRYYSQALKSLADAQSPLGFIPSQIPDLKDISVDSSSVCIKNIPKIAAAQRVKGGSTS